MNDLLSNEEVSIAGAKPALVEYFCIEGLFGYRSVSLSSKFAATVLIAQNGAGKTTLLGALDAFLKCQFARLNELQFLKIECRLKGIDDSLVLMKSDLDEIMQFAQSSDLVRVAKLYEIEVADLFHFVVSEYPILKGDLRELREHPIFRKVHLRSDYTTNSAKTFFEQLELSIGAKNARIEFIRNSVKLALGEIEIVYLPTYRRIELSLPEVDDPRVGRRQVSIQNKLGLSRRGLQSGDIQFGLSDISERLSRLNQEMLIESNQGYREISANILNDLISGAFERERPSLEERPSKEALNLFFSRLRAGRQYVGPFSDFQIPNLEHIYSEENIPENSKKFLRYFLSKLNSVMQKTRDVEGVVEEFIKNCNRYLSSHDESVEVGDKSNRRPAYDDSKILTLNRKDLRVTVSSVHANRKIPLDSLSSGEKQMISLFARLYLYPKRKILLIDEPELSLSIDWQRKILVDIVSAKSCQQIIAITHSPFVFDNALEPFATPLKLRFDTEAPNDSIASEEEDESNGE